MPSGDQAHRARQNAIGLAVVLAIALAATLLFANFVQSAAVMKCVTAGRQDCVERVEPAWRF
jgi:hypothetical protein